MPMFEQKIDQKDIKGIIQKYLKYWYLFVLGGSIAFAAAMVYLHFATPIYTASTTMLFKDEKGGGLTESSAFSDLDLLKQSKSMDNEIIVLKSKSMMEKVVSDLQLDITYIVEGSVRDVELYGDGAPVKIIMNELPAAAFGKSFIIYFKDDNSFTIEDGTKETYRFGQEITKSYGVLTIVSKEGFTYSETNEPIHVKFHNKKSLAAAYSGKLNVKPVNKNASVLRVGINDPVPHKAKDILKRLIEVYDEATVQDKNKIAAKTVDFIDDRLAYLTQELSRVEQNVETYKQENELTDLSTQAQQFAASSIENRRELEAANVQLAVLRSIENYLQGQPENEYELVPSTLTITDMTLNGLITQFNELQLERERMLMTQRVTNPQVVMIDDQLKNLKNNILENLKNIKSSLIIGRRNLMAQSGLVGDKIQQVPVIERQYIEITRQQEIKNAIYLYLLQKKEESALSLAATVSNSRIIDPPSSYGPVSPVRTNVLAYSLILGLFIPFLGIYLRNLLSNKVETKKEVEKATKTPILGEICHHKTDEAIVAQTTKRTPISEMFRLLRTNLHFSAGGKQNKKVLVTSSMSGEGKTFFCVNMAASIAGTGNKVLLIEFDLRRPKVMERLKIEEKKGLTDFLVGDVEAVESVIFPSGVDDNFDVLGAGTLPPNPAELMMNPKVAEMILNMEKKYDYIILDSPPIGKVADALTLKDHADSTIYIVRYNYTEKEQIKIVDDIFVNQKLTNPLIVLNDAKKDNMGSYTYGY